MKNTMVYLRSAGTAGVKEEAFDAKELAPVEIAVRNRYSVISAGTELACMKGNLGWFPIGSVFGYASVSEVIETGSGVERFKKGDIVFSYNKHARYCIINTANSFVTKVPEDMELSYIPFIRMMSIAFTSLRVSNIQLGDRVGILGMGLVGNFAGQLAKLQGAKVYAIDINRNRLDAAKKCGLIPIVSDESLRDHIKEQTGAEMLDALIDASGNSAVIEKGMGLLKRRGEFILLGTPRGEHNTDVTSILVNIHANKPGGLIEFKGAHEWRYPVNRIPYEKHSIERNSDIVIELIREKRILIEPVLTSIVKPEDAPGAYEKLKDPKGKEIGVVIGWN